MIALSSPALAQIRYSDGQVAAIRGEVLEKIHNYHCSPGVLCEAATPQEKARPPVGISQSRAALERGYMSATLDKCGMDGRSISFVPYFNSVKGLGTRRAMLLVALHAVGENNAKGPLASEGPGSPLCSRIGRGRG